MRLVAAAGVLVSIAVCLAAPASADDGFTGQYTVTIGTNSHSNTWTVTPCGPGCRTVATSDGWTAQAKLDDGSYVIERTSVDTSACYDPYTYEELSDIVGEEDEMYTVDPVKLTGTRSTNWDTCPEMNDAAEILTITAVR